MAWIESHQSLRDHPKTKKLARLLGVRLPEAIGILQCLWWWCVDYAPDGNLTDIDVEVVADACGWEGDADFLIRGLLDATAKKGGKGFLSDDNGLFVHDWGDYAGMLLARRESNRDRARTSYEKKKSLEDSTRSLRADYEQSEGLPTYQPTNSSRNSQEQAIPTGMSTEESTHTKSSSNDISNDISKSQPRPIDVQREEWFEAAWKLYPRKIAKAAAKAAYMARLKEGLSWDDLEQATRNYAKYCKQEKTEAQFILHGSTFYGPKERWRDFIVPLVEKTGPKRTVWVVNPEDCVPIPLSLIHI